jgi:3-phosphoglycerate kinase
MNINGKETVKLNTGWVEENVSEAIQQLMLSEVILLDNKPVKMKTKTIEKVKKINDKMINYSMEFEFANDIINNVM